MNSPSNSAQKYIVDFKTLSFGELPFEYASKEALRQISAQLLAENQEVLRKHLPADISENNSYLSVLLALIRATKEDSEYVKNHAEALSRTLPMVFSSSDFVKATVSPKTLSKEEVQQLRSEQKKALKKALEHQEILCGTLAYVDLCQKKLSRSDGISDTPWPDDFNSEEAWLAHIQEAVNLRYKQFRTNLEVCGIKTKSAPTCRAPILSTLRMDPWQYPMYPAVFSLSAVKYVFEGRTCPKKELLTPSSFNIWNTPVYRNNQFYLNGLELAQSCSSLFETELSGRYYPTDYPTTDPKQLKITRSLIRRWRFSSDDPIDNGPENNRFFVRKIPFALPLCRFRTLAIDIEKTFVKDGGIASRLITHLPALLYSPVFRKAAITQEFGRDVCEVIQVFYTLTWPDFYNTINQPDFHTRVVKVCQPLIRCGFLAQEQMSTEEAICRFLNKYFVYDRFTETGVALAFSYPCFRYKSEVLKYYSKYHKKLMGQLRRECDYSLIRSELDQAGAVPLNRKWELTIKETLTLSQAISILDHCIIQRSENLLSLASRVSTVLAPDCPKLLKILNIAQGSPSTLAAFCKQLYDETLALIAQVCIGILWQSTLRLYSSADK